MDAGQFDRVTRRIFSAIDRRRVMGVLGGLVASPLLGDTSADAKKKKSPVCLNGNTVNVSGKKRKKLMKQGATPGRCSGCAPQCNGARCGGSDGCGGTCGCPSGSLCNEGTCMPCTVACTGTPIACGAALQRALQDGGTVVACPGRYQGPFLVEKTATLNGAGPGDDPATNTILDGEGSVAATLSVIRDIVFKLSGAKITNGTQAGLWIFDDVDARASNCTFADNNGPGIAAMGAFQMTNSTVRDNRSPSDGGGVYFYGAGPHFVDNCVITGNSATNDGGGLFTTNVAYVTVTGTRIQGNTAKRGGGIFTEEGTMRLDSATSITNNLATEVGGGVARFGGTFNQNGASISGNNAPSSPNCAGVTCV